MKVSRIQNLMEVDLLSLLEESKADGFRFLERLVNDYHDGTNTFNKKGEALYGVWNENNELIAIGGLNQDPSLNNCRIGRVRRFYVTRSYRRSKVGTFLLNHILQNAKDHFESLVLHTDTVEGDRFYTAFGFNKTNQVVGVTHCINLCDLEM